MGGYREDPAPRCDKCRAATPVAELTFDASGAQACRRCAAHATVDEARALERRYGVLRRCPACRGATMRGSDDREVRQRPAVDFDTDAPDVTWRHVFTCGSCGREVTLLPLQASLGALAVGIGVGAATLASALAAPWLLVAVVLLVPVAYDGVQRVRYPMVR